MAGAMSNYLEEKILNAIFRNQTFSSPTDVYIGLYTSDPTDNDSGTEVTGGGYVRQKITFNAPTQVSGKAQLVNATDIKFPIATGAWGTVTHIALRDANVSGNLLFYGAISTPKTISVDDQLIFQAGDIKISLD